MGVSPKVPKKILFVSCKTLYSERGDLRVRRRQAFEVLLKTGQVDLNELDDNFTILERCYEPELVTLFVEYGARTDVI